MQVAVVVAFAEVEQRIVNLQRHVEIDVPARMHVAEFLLTSVEADGVDRARRNPQAVDVVCSGDEISARLGSAVSRFGRLSDTS